MVKAALQSERPLVVDVPDPVFDVPGERLGELTYDELLAEGDPVRALLSRRRVAGDRARLHLRDHRAAQGRGHAPPRRVPERDRRHPGLEHGAAPDLPVDAAHVPLQRLVLSVGGGVAGGHQVCLRRVESAAIYAAIAEHKVTHLCGAPVVMGMLINAAPGERRDFDHQVNMMTAAAPPAAVLQRMAELGIRVTHVYGLTEVYGPATVCAWQETWDALPMHERARSRRARVCYPVLEGLEVMDPATMTPVPRDGRTIGEIMMRGHDVMKGYLKDAKATEAAFQGGWFHTGDLGVMHEDGYIEVKDRSKDIIISGGENISSIEVEGALYPHRRAWRPPWSPGPTTSGARPCAFVTLKDGAAVSERDLIDHCRAILAHFKCPKTVVFAELPKTPDRQGAEERAARSRQGVATDRSVDRPPAPFPITRERFQRPSEVVAFAMLRLSGDHRYTGQADRQGSLRRRPIRVGA